MNSFYEKPVDAASARHSDFLDLQNNVDSFKFNKYFMKKISPGTEANNILSGEVEFLDKTISGFFRLKKASILGDLTEVPIPTR